MINTFNGNYLNNTYRQYYLNNNPIKNESNYSYGINTNKLEQGECKTCQARKYKDVSDDPSVSFQTPTHISPERSSSAVNSHEMEHVSNEQLYAKSENREILYQSVSLKSAICPECGKTYTAGGETRTVSREKPDNSKNDYFKNEHKKFLEGYFGKNIDIRI